MPLVSDLLAQVLGDDPTEMAVWRATKEPGSSTRVARSVVNAYLTQDLEPLPAKAASTLRPAYLTDYHGRANTPYTREFTFVAKALCYADEVAVIDELASLAEDEDIEHTVARMDKDGFPECSDLRWLLRRIARYASLEQAGLLHFVPKPPRLDPTELGQQLPDDVVHELRQMVAERLRWDPSVAERPQAEPWIRLELGSWFAEFNSIMEYADAHQSLFDVYLPGWFAGPELLEWTFQKSASNASPTEVLRQQRALTQLVTLPAPSARVLRSTALQTLPAIRESDQFGTWRQQLRAALQELQSDPTLLGTQEFEETLHHMTRTLNATTQYSSPLRKSLTSTVNMGLAAGSAALLTGQGPMKTAAVAIAPAVWSGVQNWLFAANPVPEEKVADPGRSTAAVRAFLTEPWHSTGNGEAPPTSWMRTRDGRPVALDLFNNDMDDDDE